MMPLQVELPVSALLDPSTIDQFVKQCLLALTIRSGGELELPVSAVDATGDHYLVMEVDQERRVFVFKAKKKS